MDSADLERISSIIDHDIELETKLKEQVQELDKRTRTMTGALNKIHSTPTDAIPALVDSVRPTLESCAPITEALASLVPPDCFWRWRGLWRNSLQSAVFVATLMQYLITGELLSLPRTAELLGIKDSWKNRFELPAEDYLHGLITLVNELSRFAVNAVTLGDYDRPIRISAFVKDLFAGFSMLNLKNDMLRKRFDGLKYDLKKIEEVVYDVSLRKLASSSSVESEKQPSTAAT